MLLASLALGTPDAEAPRALADAAAAARLREALAADATALAAPLSDAFSPCAMAAYEARAEEPFTRLLAALGDRFTDLLAAARALRHNAEAAAAAG